MKFSFILWVLGKKLSSKSKKDPSFKTHVKEKNFKLLIKTEDGKRARSYTFSDGDVISQKGDAPDAAVTLVWADASIAAATMTSKDPNASMTALQEGKLKIEGDAGLALWFTGTVKLLTGKAQEEQKENAQG